MRPVRDAGGCGDERPRHTFVFSIDAVLNIRFGISPLGEAARAARAIASPVRDTSHFVRLRQRRAVVQELHCDHDLSPLLVLLQEPGQMPGFLTPPPRGPLMDFDEELTRVRQATPRDAEAEIEQALEGRQVDCRTLRVLRSADAPSRLADALARVWRLLLEPSWPTVLELLERHVAYRARLLAEGGLAGLFEDLAPVVWLCGHELRVRQPRPRPSRSTRTGSSSVPPRSLRPAWRRRSSRRLSSTRVGAWPRSTAIARLRRELPCPA
jgi:hypothetical protein